MLAEDICDNEMNVMNISKEKECTNSKIIIQKIPQENSVHKKKNVEETIKEKSNINIQDDDDDDLLPKICGKTLNTSISSLVSADFCFDLPEEINTNKTKIITRSRSNNNMQCKNKSPEKDKSEEERMEISPIRRSPRKAKKKPIVEEDFIEIDERIDENVQPSTSKKADQSMKLNDKSVKPSTSKKDDSIVNELNMLSHGENDGEVDESCTSFAIRNFRRSEGIILKENKIKPNSENKNSKFKPVVKSSNDDSSSELDIKKDVKVKITMKRQRVSWEDKEILYLVYGVESFGKGRWAEILDMFKSKFKSRTNVDLKDKYRNLERNQTDLEYYKKQARLLKDKIKSQIENKKEEKVVKKKKTDVSCSSSSDSE